MGEFVGVAAFSVPNLAELKQQALLFDRIAVPGLLAVMEDGILADGRESAELCWLADQRLIFAATVPVDERQMEEMRRVESRLVDEPNYFTRFAAEQLRSQFSIDAVALESAVPLHYRRYSFHSSPSGQRFADASCHLFNARYLPKNSRPDGLIPRFQDNHEAFLSQTYSVWPPTLQSRLAASNHKDSVVDVVLKRFPFIDDQTPWERVLEFRNDPEAKSRRNALRKWMRELTRQSLKPVEIEQELDALLSEYEELIGDN